MQHISNIDFTTASCPQHSSQKIKYYQLPNGDILKENCPKCDSNVRKLINKPVMDKEETLSFIERLKLKKEKDKKERLERIKFKPPKLLQDKNLENFITNGNSKEQRIINNIKSNVIKFISKKSNFEIGNIVLLHGTVGTGKTHIATAIGKMAYDKHQLYCKFITAGDIHLDLKEAQRFESKKTEKEVAEDYLYPDVLIIDELVSQVDINGLYHIINNRFINGKTTIITTNLSQDQLNKLFNDRLVDRCKENNGLNIHFNYPSRRTIKL